MQERDFKGVWIPKEIWLNEELTLIEKCVLVEIDSLDNEDHCTASNEYLAEFCDCSQSKISKAIQKLKDMGFIEIMSFNGRQRKISVIKKERLPNQKGEAASSKRRPNNIYNNKDNKSISKEILQPAGCFKLSSKKPIVKKPNLFTKCSDLIDSYTKNPALHESLVNYLRVRLEMKDKPLYFNSWKGLLNKLDREFAEDERVAVVNQSIERGYASFFPLMKGGAGSRLKESGSRHVKSFTEEDYERETEFHEECSKKGLPTQF